MHKIVCRGLLQRMKVMKFGGAVLRGTEGFRQMSGILAALNVPAVVVVSAFSTSTRMLEAAAEAAKNGEQELALAIGRTVMDENRAIAVAILPDKDIAEALSILIDQAAHKLQNYLRGVAITRQLTGRTLDLIRSFGEFLALHIVKHYLENNGIRAVAADAADIIVSDDNHGAATPLSVPTSHRLTATMPQLFTTADVVVIQGYVARGAHGEITTMGKESSNLTAALLGELLLADDVTIWTDVEGIFSADPALVSDASQIPAMNWQDAELAAHNGVKPLYPTMIEPMRRAQIPLVFRSAFAPDGRATIIDNASYPHPKIIAAAPRQNSSEQSVVTLINISPHEALDAIRVLPEGLLEGTTFGIEAGIEPNVQKMYLPTAKATEAVKFFHEVIVKRNGKR